MKKVISLVLAVAILASMFIMAIPVSAAGSIKLSASSVKVNADGSYGKLTATVSGVSTSPDPWLAIVPKESWEGSYVTASHYGWFQLTKGGVKDGTVVDISQAAQVDSARGSMYYDTEYLVVLIDERPDGTRNVVATAPFKTTAGYWVSTTAGTGLAVVEEGLWLSHSSSEVTTYFEATGEFTSLAFTAWAGGDSKWKFELINSANSVVYSNEQVVKENVQVTLQFPAKAAGKYGFRVSAVDGFDSGRPGNEGDDGYFELSPKNYLVLPTAEIVDDSVYSEFGEDMALEGNSGGGGVGPIMEGYAAIAFGVYMTGNGMVADKTPAQSAKPTQGTSATQAPVATDEPTVDEPTVDEPTVDEPTVDEPTVDEPTVDEPTVDEPTVDEPTEDEPTEDEPTEDEPTASAGTDEDDKTGNNKNNNKDDKDDEEGGLGGGAIAAIIIAAVVVLGGAAAAVYMFVIKKKS